MKPTSDDASPRHGRRVEPAHLTGEDRNDAEHRPASQHLHRDPKERSRRQVRAGAVERADRPEDGRAEEDARADEIDRGASAGRPDEGADAGQSKADPDERRAREAQVEEEPAEDGDPERKRGDQERRDARPDGCLPHREEAVSSEEQEAADDRGVAPLARARPRLTSAAASCREIEDGARDQEPDRALGERWDRPDRDPDREVRGAPDDVEGGEGERDLGAGRAERAVGSGLHPGRMAAGRPARWRAPTVRQSCHDAA